MIHGKTNLEIWLSVLALALAGCSTDLGTGVASTGGDGFASGGTAGSGGGGQATSSGGNAGTGGRATSSSGTTGSGGITSTGGITGSGGAPDFDAGTPSAGGITGAGGGASSTGGTSSTDAAASGGTTSVDGGTTRADGGTHRMRLFVTHDKWDGNLMGAANGADAGGSVTSGLAGGDWLCQISARGAGLGGNWIAWLSDSHDNAIDRLKEVGPWYGLDGVELFANKAALAGDPSSAIDVDERGSITDYAPWTGTHADGTATAFTCADWQSNSPHDYGMCGGNTSTTDEKWSEDVVPQCNNPYNLYCFEQ